MKTALAIIAAALYTIGFAAGYQHGKLNRSAELVPHIKNAQEQTRLAILQIEREHAMLTNSLNYLEASIEEIKSLNEENAKLRAQLASNTIPVYSDITSKAVYPINEIEISQ